ncbi:MAG: AraC family transcriptional regulator [Spirochaetota bacterium]|mgnify:CR=1 FL=1
MSNLIAIGRILPRMHTPMHQHDEWEIVVYLEGSGTSVIEGVSHPFSAGTVVCIPPGHEHNDNGEKYRSIWIQFQRMDAPRTPIIMQEPAHAPLSRIADILCSEFSRGVEHREFCDSMLDALIMGIVADEHLPRHHPSVETLKRELTAHVHDADFKVRDALRDHALSSFHLSRLFTKAVGKSPRQYLITLRIRETAALIRMGAGTIRAIAREFGFKDPYHFSRLFKQRMGVSPARYRR